MALGVRGRLRPRIFSTFGTTRAVSSQPYAPDFTPGLTIQLCIVSTCCIDVFPMILAKTVFVDLYRIQLFIFLMVKHIVLSSWQELPT